MRPSGYQIELSSPDCVLCSGMHPYWHIDFTSLIREVNKNQTVNEVVFPDPTPTSGYSGVSYSLTDKSGNEILKNSFSLKEKAIPLSALKTLQAAIEKIHAWAEDPRVPQEKRDFCRKFALPDPWKDPEAYRLTGGMFSRKLHVLWGYQKKGTEVFLPASRVSAKWDDCSSRKSIFKECRGSLWRRIFRPRNVVLSCLAIVGVYLGVLFPVKCPTHQCLVGKGVYHCLFLERACPERCILPGCNRHLDEKKKCHAHKCTKCGRMLPTSNGQKGVCDECFWDIK